MKVLLPVAMLLSSSALCAGQAPQAEIAPGAPPSPVHEPGVQALLQQRASTPSVMSPKQMQRLLMANASSCLTLRSYSFSKDAEAPVPNGYTECVPTTAGNMRKAVAVPSR